jgi:hypothetical protein
VRKRHIVVLHFDDFSRPDPRALVRACSDATSDVPIREALPQRLSCSLRRLTRGPGKLGMRSCLRTTPSASETSAPMFCPAFDPMVLAFDAKCQSTREGIPDLIWRCLHSRSLREVSASGWSGCISLLAKGRCARVVAELRRARLAIWLLERCKRRDTNGSVMTCRPPNLRWAPRTDCSACGRRAPRNRGACRDEWLDQGEVRTRVSSNHPSLPPNHGGARRPD